MSTKKKPEHHQEHSHKQHGGDHYRHYGFDDETGPTEAEAAPDTGPGPESFSPQERLSARGILAPPPSGDVDHVEELPPYLPGNLFDEPF